MDKLQVFKQQNYCLKMEQLSSAIKLDEFNYILLLQKVNNFNNYHETHPGTTNCYKIHQN